MGVLTIHFILHRLENRTRPISTPYNGRRWWDSNLRTPACVAPALPLCYKRGQQIVMHHLSMLTLKVLVATIDAQWEEMGDVGSARYEVG